MAFIASALGCESRHDIEETRATVCSAFIQPVDSVLLNHGLQSSLVEPVFFASSGSGFVFGDRSEKRVLHFGASGALIPVNTEIGPAHGELLTLFGGGVFQDSVVLYDYNAAKVIYRSLASGNYRELPLDRKAQAFVRSLNVNERGDELYVHYPVGSHAKSLYTLHRRGRRASVKFGNEAEYYERLPRILRGIVLPRTDYRHGVIAAALVGRPTVDLFTEDGARIVRLRLQQRAADSIVQFEEQIRQNGGSVYVEAENGDSILVGAKLLALSSVHLLNAHSVLIVYTRPAEGKQMRARFDQDSKIQLVTVDTSRRSARATPVLQVHGGVVGVDGNGLIVSILRSEDSSSTWLIRSRTEQSTDRCHP